jgi:toxin CptA
MFLPLELNLRPSRVYRVILALAHGLALAGIWLAALPVWAKVLMTVVLLIGGVWLWRENSNGLRSLRVSQSGQIELLDGEWLPAGIKGQAVVLPWFVSLELVPEAGKTRRLALLPDSTEADGFRKLRVWLKWAAPAG